MTIVSHHLTFVLAMPPIPALPVALPDPRGELQRLVDHLLLEVLPWAGLFRWTSDGPDFEDHVHLGPRGQHFTITINRGARHRGGVAFSEGLTVTAPDGSTRRYALLMGKESLLKLLALLRARHHVAECGRLRGDLLALLADYRGQRLVSSVTPRLGGQIGREGETSLLTVTSALDGTLVYPSFNPSYLHFAQEARWIKRYPCFLTPEDLARLLRAIVAQHNALS